MSKQKKSHALTAVALLVLVVLGCAAGDDTDQANKLVHEGNAAVDEVKKFVTDGQDHSKKMLAAVDGAHLLEARTLARETIADYGKAEEKCKEAANKYEAASKLKVKDKFKEYLTLKTKEFNKRAELVETAKGTPQALIDSQNPASFISRMKATNEKIETIKKEAADIGAQADKLQTENPDIFKP